MKTISSQAALNMNQIHRHLLAWALTTLIVVVAVGAVKADSLFNIDFGQDGNGVKVGPAAIGQSANDFWNFYTRDDGTGGWRTFGAMTDLKLASGAVTTTGLTVDNAPGSWGNGSADPMYVGYIYPFGGVATIKLTNLLAGTYELLVYSQDGNYQLNVGATDYGSKTCRDNSPAGLPAWQEGRQYVRFDNIGIGAGGELTLTVQPGLDGYAIISGLQLVSVPEPGVGALLGGAALLGIFRKRRHA